MDELDNRNISLQRKKPPWLKLDIPVIQLTPDETPTLKPGQCVTETGVGGYKSMQFLSNVVMGPTLNNRLRSLDRCTTQSVQKAKAQAPRRAQIPTKSTNMMLDIICWLFVALWLQIGAVMLTVSQKQNVMKVFGGQPSNTPVGSLCSRGTADWFGVSKDSDSTQRWRRKSLQHCSHLYGGLKAQIVDPLSRGRAFRVVEEADGSSVPQTPVTPCTASLCSHSSSRSALNRLPRRRKRESVAVMSLKAAGIIDEGTDIR
ncbi:hypothetical protein fugu_001124 [Takifugu bimaculatus]|uniref:Inactive rhomboid protein n=1 Tax=Takifugu bimaculatus TaxID=433685 RepID=A0A4Z2CIT9_9TELE|nr:hypothetical protein fugu_001124 [Takifugu bimaculatus]